MQRWTVLGLLLSCHVAFSAEVRVGGHVFTVPDGFDVQLVAGPPLVDRPITADFDERGRLYVADSSGTNDKVQKQLEERPHRVVRLEDTNGDGVFDKSVVFADKLMFPEGTLWHDGSLYVAAPPSIWKLTDTDGDGVCDRREEWFQGRTLTGCANDLHGPYLGPDGWIYWNKGAFAEQTHTVHGRPWTSRASHIFRCRPDGSGLEPVMTGGMDNPVDTVFLPSGDRIFTTTFFVHPGNGQRDGLIHAIYGGVYGKEHGVLDGHPRTGPLMPVLTHMGAAAPCGLASYESRVFGDDYFANVFACQFNLQKVSRHVLTPDGSTYRSQDSDFLVSNQRDFHPTDVLEDADGSLVVVDTGGWYKLCCPTSQLGKPDILGGIYRVRRRSGPRLADPRGTSLAWNRLDDAELFRLHGDLRPAVRRRAIATLADRWQDAERMNAFLAAALPTLADKPRAFAWSAFFAQHDPSGAWGRTARTSFGWLLTRLPHATAREVLLGQFDDATAVVPRANALHAVSLHRVREAGPALLTVLRTGSPAERRLAAESLGRLGEPAAVPHLLAAASREDVDRTLEHALIYALIELADPSATEAGLTSPHPRTQKVALIALAEMKDRPLPPARVVPLLTSQEPMLRETAHWLVGRRPEWGGALIESFRTRLASAGSDTSALEEQLTRLAAQADVQRFLATSAADATLPAAARQCVLRAMAGSRPKELPPSWTEALARVLKADDATLRRAGVSAARQLPAPKQVPAELRAALLQFAAESGPVDVRLDALAAVPGGLTGVSAEQLAFLLAHVAPDQPIAIRASAAEALSKASLSVPQLERLTESLRTVSPLELDRLLMPYERVADEALGLKLLATLREAPALPSLRVDGLKQRLAKYGPAVHRGAEDLHALVNLDLPAQRKRLEELLPAMSTGDVRRGQAIFNHQKSACLACHRSGYLGGNVGPDLTRIGGIRTERDLLESILFPSLSFVRSYEPVALVLTDGRVVNGLIRSESATDLLLATGPNQELRVARSDIEEQRPGTVSVMPAGLEKQLTVQELADLVAFLKNAK